MNSENVHAVKHIRIISLVLLVVWTLFVLGCLEEEFDGSSFTRVIFNQSLSSGTRELQFHRSKFTRVKLNNYQYYLLIKHTKRQLVLELVGYLSMLQVS